MKSAKHEINDVDYVYNSIRSRVNNLIINYLPDVWEKFTSINTLLKSDNIESRSNSVNSCRRVFEELAHFLPNSNIENKNKSKNRIKNFLDSIEMSNTHKSVITGNFNLYKKCIDDIYNAGNKGAHKSVISKSEAETYIMNTYLLVGDILTLWYANNKPEDLIRGLENTIFYDTKHIKTTLHLYYSMRLSPYKLVISRNTQCGTRIRIYIKEGNNHRYDYDLQDILPSDVKGFESGELSVNSYLQIGTYNFSEDTLPVLLIAIKGTSTISLLILQYEPKDRDQQYGSENWKIIGRFQGQSVAILHTNQIFMPFGSVGFARLIKFENGIFVEETDDVLLKKEQIFGEHPDM